MASSRVTNAVVLLSMDLGAFAHGDDEMAAHNRESHDGEPSKTDPTTYVTLESHQLAIRVHISLMVLSWFIILQIGN
jgi:hypothetical protein